MRKLFVGLAVATSALLGLSTSAFAKCGDVSMAEMNWASAELMANIDKVILEEGYGCNVVTGEFVKMIDKGIIDPVLVTKSALKNAVSVALTVMSADCVISNIRIDNASN